MEAVEKKYAPKDRMTTVDAHKKLFSITMKTREDPTNIFEKISEIEMSHNTTSNKLDDSLLIAVVMKVVPIEYASVVSAAMLDKYGDKMTLDNLETELSKHFRVLSAKWSDGPGKDHEVNLSSVDAGQGNKKCYNCGENGHISKNCPQKKKNGGAGKQGKNNHKNKNKIMKRNVITVERRDMRQRSAGRNTQNWPLTGTRRSLETRRTPPRQEQPQSKAQRRMILSSCWATWTTPLLMIRRAKLTLSRKK